ncbi:alpha/beta hydrolase, partial [Klebsiella pneumoniae]|nr:alpha/beta hydrolase [Klebsiella pneumoniae]
RPVVVFFYGGSWQNGARSDYLFVGQALTSRGFVAVLPDYRTYPDTRFPGFMEDAAAAVRWARDHAAEYGGDPSRIFLMGHSAGAHIVALLATDGHYLAAQHM